MVSLWLGAQDPPPLPGIQPLDARSDRVFRAERSQRIGSKGRRAGVTGQPLRTLGSHPSLLATSPCANVRAKQEPSRFCHTLSPSWLQAGGWEMLAQWSREKKQGVLSCMFLSSSPRHFFVWSTLTTKPFKHWWDRATKLFAPIPTSL